eukprot:5839538-Prymnesium_polylepis.2
MQTGQIDQAESILEPVEAPESQPVKTPLSEDRLNKLKKARERASEVARQKREAKTPSRDDPIVVVENSDSDELEGPPGVIFVRRKSSKPKAEPAQYPPEMNYLFASMFGPTRSTY